MIPRLPHEQIRAEILVERQISKDELYSKSLRQPIVEARWAYWLRLRRELGWGVTKIARHMGMDHGTVSKALKKEAA